jgi:hypothetical protein
MRKLLNAGKLRNDAARAGATSLDNTDNGCVVMKGIVGEEQIN